MPARDFYHDVVKAALIADGWTITDDSLKLHVGKKDLFVDLGAERLLAADKEGRKIAVEVKSFAGASDVADLEIALGQYILYRDILEQTEPDRLIYLAVSWKVYDDLFQEPIGQLLLRREQLRLIVFDPAKGSPHSMDTAIDSVRTIIERVLTEYSKDPYSYGEIESQLVFDRERDHYLLLSVGWDKSRVHSCVIHIDLISGKCWIQRDGSESGIAHDLEAAGIPKDRIVLGFKPPEIRPITGYAVA